MISEMVLSPKPLAACFTGIRSLIGVCAFVDEQVVGLAEVTSAKTADVLLLWSVAKNDRNINIKAYFFIYALGHFYLKHQ